MRGATGSEWHISTASTNKGARLRAGWGQVSYAIRLQRACRLAGYMGPGSAFMGRSAGHPSVSRLAAFKCH